MQGEIHGGTRAVGTLILGASGFLGAQLARRQEGLALAAGLPGGAEQVVGVCRRPQASQALFPGLALVACDLSVAGRATELLDRLRPRRVLLAAALARQHDCDADPDLARCLNEELPGEVAASCARRGARLVHISTDLVFSSRAPRGGFNEGAVPDATSVYGRSKARGEVRVLVAYPKALVVRLPLLYGDSLGRGLGASDGLLAALKRGERPLLFEDEWRTPLDVTAAAAALVHLAQLEVAGLLHLAGPQRLSRLELGRTVLAARALAPHKVRAALRREVPGCVERPEDVSLCAARALALLPAPMPSPEEALGAG